MPPPRHKVIYNPIPTSLFLLTAFYVAFGYQYICIYIFCIMCLIQQNKDVGMGL